MVAALKIVFWLFTPGIFLLGSLALAQEKPQRIVSLSLCTDHLLLLLVKDRSRIASISYLAADPEFSFLAGETNDLALNRGQAEEVLSVEPDLILSSQFSASAAVALLKRLGHEVTVLDFPTTLNDAYLQIRKVASLVAEEKAGEALIKQMRDAIQQSLKQVAHLPSGQTAVFYSSNGFSYGSSTLRDNFLQQLGLKNIAAETGMVGPGQLSLEALIRAEPGYLLIDEKRSYTDYLAHPMLKHPALAKLFTAERVITIPDTLFQCAGPSLIEAFSLMANGLNDSPDFIQSRYEAL